MHCQNVSKPCQDNHSSWSNGDVPETTYSTHCPLPGAMSEGAERWMLTATTSSSFAEYINLIMSPGLTGSLPSATASITSRRKGMVAMLRCVVLCTDVRSE